AGSTPAIERDERTVREPAWPLLPRELPVMAASSLDDLNWMLDLAASRRSPVMVVVPQDQAETAPEVFPPPEPPEFGQGQCVCEGADLSIIAWGAASRLARRVAFELARYGVESAVINPVFLRPLDESLIVRVARNAGCAVVLEDPSLPSELMLPVLSILSQGGDTIPFVRIAEEFASTDVDDFIQRAVARCQALVSAANPRAATRISKSIQPLAAAHRERSAVQACSPSPEVSRWIEAYSGVGRRDLYLWRWARRGAELTTLPCVSPEVVADVCDTKVLSIMVCVLLDDVADSHGSGEFLELLIRLACEQRPPDYSRLNAEERQCAKLVEELSREYERRIRGYPRFSEYEELLRFDAAQFANTLRYSNLVNRHISYMNLAEHDLYLPHNMHMMSFAMLDLMCSRDFPSQEVGKLRQAAWHGQCMGRIGNLLSTWRRELASRDMTSGIFAREVSDGELSPAQIAVDDPRSIERSLRHGKHEYYFIRRWQHHRDAMEATLGKIQGVRLETLLEGHDRFFQMHLASQGSI
ncbi:MAG: transketolase C-terminal domain-containing protein, partial [Pirellulales bacterium]